MEIALPCHAHTACLRPNSENSFNWPAIVTVFPILKIARLRTRAAKVCAVPDETPDGWSKSAVDPMRLLAVFTSLQIKPGLILRAYQFRSGGNGNGCVWALPEDAPFPDPELCARLADGFLEPPEPPVALDDVMDAVEGDGSPWAYMSASLFAREAAEFGAMWHGANWSTYTILGAAPWQTKTKRKGRPDKDVLTRFKKAWTWYGETPANWKPYFDIVNGVPQIIFLAYSGLGRERICRFKDTFEDQTLRFSTDVTMLAEGSTGYVF
jgi:hypothetical protein